MRYAVFIASHINYDGQLDYLINAIKSVKNQDYKNGNIDIWLSISFKNTDFKDEFDALMIADNCFKCFIHDKQMYQMEHFKVLNDNSYLDYLYELIFFLDDDDTYSVDRISKFDELYKNTYKFNKDVFNQTLVFWEDAKAICNNGKPISCYIYWTFAVKQDAFNAFFSIFKERNLQHIKADMLLKMYFERLLAFNDEAVADNGLYNYNTENDNSVTASKSDKNDDIYLRTCMNDKKFLEKHFGRNYKSKIDKTLWRTCYEAFHRYKTIEEFYDSIAIIINKNLSGKKIRSLKLF